MNDEQTYECPYHLPQVSVSKHGETEVMVSSDQIRSTRGTSENQIRTEHPISAMHEGSSIQFLLNCELHRQVEYIIASQTPRIIFASNLNSTQSFSNTSPVNVWRLYQPPKVVPYEVTSYLTGSRSP